MARIPELPPHALSEAEIEAFRRDGVICVRGLYSPKWLEVVTEALDDIVSKPSPVFGARRDEKFRQDVETWLTDDRVRDFVLFGPSAHIAQQAFGSKKIDFFYDQIFVKQVLTPDPTPWHQDFTFWPMAGKQIASLWMSVDPATPESSALEFVAGSHLWPQRYKALGVGGAVLSDAQLDDIPDIEADRSKFNILSWSLEPGDALLFHALVLHGSRGNSSSITRRRAITTRWCGDDVVYNRIGRQMPIPWRHGKQNGEPLGGPIFPQILPELVESEIAERMAGPVFPDPEMMAEAGRMMAETMAQAARAAEAAA